VSERQSEKGGRSFRPVPSVFLQSFAVFWYDPGLKSIIYIVFSSFSGQSFRTVTTTSRFRSNHDETFSSRV